MWQKCAAPYGFTHCASLKVDSQFKLLNPSPYVSIGLTMNQRIETFEWFETPPMRWSALGFGGYIFSFVVSMAVFSFSLGAFILLYGLRAKPPWWYHERWPTILTALAGGAVAGFVLRSIPPNIQVTREKIVRRTGFWESEWFFKDCRSIYCNPVRGVLLIKLELSDAGSSRECRPVLITARMKDSSRIDELLRSSGCLRDADAWDSDSAQ